MSTSSLIQKRIEDLKKQYDRLKIGKDSLLKIIDEAEIPESVYNSNAIENSTLTLKETEKILLEMEVSRNVSLREVFEAKNLARVLEYIRNKSQEDFSKNAILLLHQMLIGNIDESIAGRLRKKGEYVRVGTFIAIAPEHVERRLEELLIEYSSDYTSYFLDKISKFHLVFENIHPFNDGNGRTGRILMVLQLIQDEVISLPILYISGYINKNRTEYYKLLRQVTTKEDWNSFILFMLSGFYLQAKETKEILFNIMKLFHSYKDEIKNKHKKIYTADLIEALFSFPIITPVKLGKELGIHYTTASRHLVTLEKSGFLKENVVGKYHFYTNQKLLNIMKK